MIHTTLAVPVLTVALALVLAATAGCVQQSPAAGPPGVSEVSQYGITWHFDRPVRAGRFITGDWWVIGPVTVTHTTPQAGPADAAEAAVDTGTNRWGDTSLRNDTRMRNGSMIVLTATQRQGYDSRSQTYDPKLSVTFPVTVEPSRSLVSTISAPPVRRNSLAHKIMWDEEKKGGTVLDAAAVLTVLAAEPPADAFRPCYAGTDKRIYRAQDLRWDLLQRLPAPAVDPKAYLPYYEIRLPDDWAEAERWFQRPWIDHMCNWMQQQLNPCQNSPAYGREHARLVSMASLLLHLDVPDDRKRPLLTGLVQYGIDTSGVAKVGGSWNWGGGHTSGRKWPMVFASLMLDDPALREVPDTCVFHEDAQTYYGTGWAGQTALYWMVQHHGQRDRYEEKSPEQWTRWDRSSESYRLCCNGRAWAGTALAARLCGAVAAWNHDAFFDYVDRTMAAEDAYAAHRGRHRRPDMEGGTFDPFVDAMWRAYREQAPAQSMAGNPRMFVWTGDNYAYTWVANPKPTDEQVAAHLAEVRAARDAAAGEARAEE
ncbi:MAG: hypothetical protein GX591_18400 [Planctomycetes bacterium]|nr:hypothetical protein [Planctomycetota bacterium]